MAEPTESTDASAPNWFIYCPRCASVMSTARVMDKARRVCPSCNYIFFTDPKVGVGVLVEDEGRLLLVRRGMNPERGKWSLPAGYVDQGEDPKATAAREAWEETGLVVEVDEVLDVFHNSPGAGGASIFILYRARVVGGEIIAGDDAEDARFFSPDDLPELAFASTRAAVDRFLRQ